MNKKEATSLLVSGLAITGGVLSAYFTFGATTAAPMIIGKGLETLGGLGGGLASNAFQKHFIDKHPQDDVLKNGDLTRAVGNAIFKLCGALASETTDKNDKKSLQKLSETSPETWENLILGGEYEEGYGLSFSKIDLDEVSAEKSVQYFHAWSEDLDEVTALDTQMWQSIIETLCEKQRCSLNKSAKEILAAKLHKEFAKALRQVLIDDFSKDGKAFASMQFRLFGEILTYAKENFAYAKEAFELSDSILPIVIDLSKKVDELNQNSPKNYSSENKENWEKIFADFDSFRETLDKTYQNTETIIGTQTEQGKKLDKQDEKLDKILENQENQPKTAISFSKFLPKNFPQSLIYFTGREQVLKDIAEALKNHGTAAFADTHGVGKSSVAIEFAHRNQANYKHILFIRATNNEFNIYVSDVLKDLGIALPEDAKPEERLAVLQKWLAENHDWLLLVDNVDDVDFIHDCKFNKPTGKVIYTSNNDKIFKVGTKVELPKLNDENAMLLLYKHWQDEPDAKFEDIPDEAHTALKGIAEKFGNHPFSMAFVGSYLAEEDESLEEFLEAYQSKEKNLLQNYEFLTDYHQKNVATAFLFRFEQISTPKDDTEREQFLSIAVKDYLKLSAYVGTDNIPEELLQQSLAKLHPDQAEWTENKDFIRDIYRKFRPTSIFKRQPPSESSEIKFGTLSTHRIVQEIMRFQIKDEEDLILETLAEVLAGNFDFFEFINKEKVERYLSHVDVFLKYLGQNKPERKSFLKLENELTALLCNDYARYFEQYGQYEKAEKYYELAKNILEGKENVNQISLAIVYGNLAQLYNKQKKNKEAEPLYKRGLEISEKELGENHPNTAIFYGNFAKFYDSEDKPIEAELLYKKAANIFREVLGENHIHTATFYNDFAAHYFRRGNLKLARKYQQKSLNARLATFGENHPNVAANYWWLGVFCSKEEKYREGLDYFYKAHEIYSRFFSEEHPVMLNLQAWIDKCEPLANK
jgi:hypothetical protein